MSYELVRSINTKKRTFTSASNNVRPLIYATNGYMEDMSEEEFIKTCLVDFMDGNLHSNGNSLWKFDYAIIWFEKNKKELYNYIYNVRWNSYIYKNGDRIDLYTQEERRQATETLKNELYKIYSNIAKHKEKYIIKYCGGLMVKTTASHIFYTYSLNRAKVFNSYEEAYTYYYHKVFNRFDGSSELVKLEQLL